MDPLSITASTITVIGVLRQAAKCVQALRLIRQAPEELKALLEEVVDVQNLLEQLQSAGGDDQQVQTRPCGVDGAANAPLARLVERTSSKLDELASLVSQHKICFAHGSRFDLKRIEWVRGRHKAQGLCNDLRVLRLDVAASLGADTSSAVKRIEVAVEQGNGRQARIEQNLSSLVNALTVVPSSGPSSFEIAAEGGSLSWNFSLSAYPSEKVTSVTSCQSQHFQTMTRYGKQTVKASKQRQAMQICGKKSKTLCKEWCSCICHQKRVLKVKEPFFNIVGSFSLACSGLPWITSECDQKSCKSRSVPTIAMTVQFPAWLWKRYLSSSYSFAPLHGPQVSLRLPRVVGWDSKLWRLGLDGNLQGIQDLYAKGLASPWDVSPTGGSVLHYAADHGHFKLCKFLVEEGAHRVVEADCKGSPAELAWDQVLSARLAEEDEYLVTSTFADTDFLQSRQYTILHKIVLRLVPRTLESELAYSTKDINVPDSSGRTCVSWAAARGDTVALKTLLEHGADPGISDGEGSAPLHHVRDVACGRLLINAGVDIHSRNNFGRTALHAICRDKSGEYALPMLRTLVDNGIDMNARDHGGETALINASFNRCTACAEYMLAAGADPDLVSNSGDAALHFTVMLDAHHILKVLLDMGADWTIKNFCGQTLLHFAAMAEMKTLDVLVEHGLRGIDVAAVDGEGKTAKDVLVQREEDDESIGFKDRFLGFLERIEVSVGVEGQDQDMWEHSNLRRQLDALELTKEPTVTCLTPLSSADEDDDCEDSILDGDYKHGPPVFYDALEVVDHTPPALVA